MLPVDNSSRPLQDVNSDKGGEFTRQVEIVSKKEKKHKDSGGSDGEGENKHKKRNKKDRKKEKKSKKRKYRDDSDDEDKLEAGEIVEPHPLVTLTNIDPDEIPDQPSNKFLMRGGPRKHNDRSSKRDSGNERDRRYQKRQREWGGDYYRRTRTTKSGRIVKGRGKFCFRTPSRSRSRSITPIHWRKEEARVIKMSDFEKLDAERKRLEATKSVNGKEKMSFDRSRSREKQDAESYTPKKRRNSNIDYNALDYEEPGDNEHEIKKQVPSLVQYPLPGAYNTFKSAEEVQKDLRREEENQEELAAINKRSDFLAIALGVQIKTGEDPPQNETEMSGIAKQNRNKFHSQTPGNANRGNQDRIQFPGGRYSDEGRYYRPPFHYRKETPRQRTPPIPQIASKVEEKKPRNKFETEKKAPTVESQVTQKNGRFEDQRRAERERRYRDNDRKGRYERERDRRRGAARRSRSKERRKSRSSSRGSKDRRRSKTPRRSRTPNKNKDLGRLRSPKKSRSPRRSRSNNRSRKRSRSRRRSRSTKSPANRPRSKSAEIKLKKETETGKPKEDLLRMDKDAEEKYKKLLILRKKMELLELKKKKEEEQKLMEEKQRKAKEESEMLEKAKWAKREAIEKEKLMKSYKVLQELDGKKPDTRRRSSSSSSASSSSSSSSSSSDSFIDTSKKKERDTMGRQRKRDRREFRSRSRSRKRSPERKLRSRSRSRERKYPLPRNFRK